MPCDAVIQYFVDGITEDLTTDLSNIPGMLVISRNSAFTYKGKSVDTKQIGRELGVRYVLEGSVRRSGNHVRINAQLIDAETNGHLWAERFDRDASDLFALQNEITGRIANTLNLTLIRAEGASLKEHPDVQDYVMRGRAIASGPLSRETRAEALSLYEHALALDPQSVEAQSRLAAILVGRVLDGLTDTRSADIARVEALVARVLAASPRDLQAHFTKGNLLRVQHRCVDAIAEYETVLESNRNNASAISNIGRCKIFQGLFEEGIARQQQAIRLSPRDPDLSVYLARIGEAYLLQSRIAEAIVWLEKSRSVNPSLAYNHNLLASAYALDGDLDRATAEVAEARRLGSDFSSLVRVRANSSVVRDAPAIRSLVEATFIAGLRKAGVPEEE
jgi:adenylate cyclase